MGHCWYQSSGSLWSPVEERKSTLGSFMVAITVSKKDAQLESCKLSFIWGKMRTAARETAPQIALRNCSKEMGEGEVRIYMILVKGKYMQSNIYFSRRFLLVS